MRLPFLALVVLTACSSNYMPRSRGRVATTLRAGQVAYVRDGRVYEHGLLGGGLVDAVQGNARATLAANEYHDRIRTGLIAALLGIGGMIGGTGYALSGLDDNGSGDEQRAKTGLLVALGGMVLSVIGAGYAASAEPYRWDAINMFNDDADAMPAMPLPAYGPPRTSLVPSTTSSRTSMKMRD